MLVSIGRKQSERGDARDLVAQLLDCHDRIRTFVALAKAAGERADLPDAERSEACTRVARYFREALPLHVADEEQSVWPRLRAHDAAVDRALTEMHEQHEQHAPKLQVLLAAAAQLEHRPSEVACQLALAQAADALTVDFAEHLQLEETIIFPAIRRVLSAELQAEIMAEQRKRSGV